MGTVGGLTANAHAINLLGQVVGEADTGSGYRHAFLWSAGTIRDLGVSDPRHTTSWAQDINNLGHIAMNSGGGDFWKAFILISSEWMPLPGIGAFSTSVYTLNDSDVAAGISGPSHSLPHAILWQDGIMTDLFTHGYQGLPFDINSAGAVIGGSLWYEGSIVPMPPLSGSGGKRINNYFQVAGTYPFEDGQFHAFLWTDGRVIDIGALIAPGPSTSEALNNHGQVVVQKMGCPDEAFLYDPEEGIQNLFALLEIDTPWRELTPHDINDLGQIVGVGTLNGFRRAFLMTPVYADYNESGEIDLFDLGCFAGCMGAPGESASSACVVGDTDHDDDVDLRDFWIIQRVVEGGPGV